MNTLSKTTLKRFVVLTGLSGAGRTTGLYALEDLGFFKADNVPPSLWVELLNEAERAGFEQVAVGLDVRAKNFFGDIDEVFRRLRERVNVEIVFLDARDDVLIKRYNFTRRTHPLGQAPLSQDIAEERQHLGVLRALADTVLDTSQLSTRELVETLQSRFGRERQFRLRLMSFGFKRGVPIDADTVLDLRALPNPYYDPELRPLPGTDKRVQMYVFQPSSLEFYTQMREFVRTATAMAKETGRSSYTVALGCTGGQHRSVAVAERLKNDLSESFATSCDHRDVAQALAEHTAEHSRGVKNA